MAEQNIKRIIIDVDMGTDDYLALLILLYAERIGKVKIEAIVCSMGNTTVENVLNNVVRLLEIEKRTDIPIYKGTEKQLIDTKETIVKYNGEDGFADLHHDKQPDLSIVRDIPAAIAVCDLIINNPNEISIICVGPLTNLALALKLNNIASKIKDVWIMGGNYTDTTTGNETAAAEFNFYVDPEAAHIVFESLKCPVFILPWEPCVVSEISFDWRYNILGDNSPALHLLTRAEKIVYHEHKFWLPCDAFLCFCFLEPKKHITKNSLHHVTIELHNGHSRGQVVLEHKNDETSNVTIIERFDTELFKELVLEATSL